MATPRWTPAQQDGKKTPHVCSNIMVDRGVFVRQRRGTIAVIKRRCVRITAARDKQGAQEWLGPLKRNHTMTGASMMLVALALARDGHSSAGKIDSL